MKKLSSSSTCTNLFRSGLDKAKPAFLRIEPELQAMFDRARKQEPVQIFAKAEDSRDPAVVYAQAKWFESYVKLRVGLQTPLAAAGRFPVGPGPWDPEADLAARRLLAVLLKLRAAQLPEATVRAPAKRAAEPALWQAIAVPPARCRIATLEKTS